MSDPQPAVIQSVPDGAAPLPGNPPADSFGAEVGGGQVRCERCGAPVEAAQRYCVACGHHRSHVPDPATDYLAQASVRRRAAGPAAARRSGRRRGGGIAAALLIALVPVAAAIGVEVGRSGDNANAALARALNHQRPTTVIVQQTGGATASVSTAGSKKAARHRAKAATPVVRKTAYGTVTQAVGAKVTKAEAAAGAAEATNVQKSSGTGYVNADNNLPTTVVP